MLFHDSTMRVLFCIRLYISVSSLMSSDRRTLQLLNESWRWRKSRPFVYNAATLSLNALTLDACAGDEGKMLFSLPVPLASLLLVIL